MAMGVDVEKKLTEMFANKSKFSVSLDAWTSSNGYAFIAIALHWIDNKGELCSSA
ncbi:hypothetical protein B0H10DRAFT_1879187, partial [Mycena sp. CBHHK59/15]